MRGMMRSVMTMAGPKARDFLERVLAVDRRLGNEAPAFQQLLESDARGGIVLDDEDPLGNRMLRLRGWSERDLRLPSS